MAFEKVYPNRKDWRKYGSWNVRSIDPGCRSHGDCPACKSAREYQVNKAMERMDQELREWQTT